jgi:hypothetical protein
LLPAIFLEMSSANFEAVALIGMRFPISIFNSNTRHNIEKDGNGDVLWTWMYPSISADLKAVIDRKTTLRDEEIAGSRALFTKYQNSWVYIYTSAVDALDNAASSQVAPLLRLLSMGLVLL